MMIDRVVHAHSPTTRPPERQHRANSHAPPLPLVDQSAIILDRRLSIRQGERIIHQRLRLDPAAHLRDAHWQRVLAAARSAGLMAAEAAG